MKFTIRVVSDKEIKPKKVADTEDLKETLEFILGSFDHSDVKGVYIQKEGEVK